MLLVIRIFRLEYTLRNQKKTQPSTGPCVLTVLQYTVIIVFLNTFFNLSKVATIVDNCLTLFSVQALQCSTLCDVKGTQHLKKNNYF